MIEELTFTDICEVCQTTVERDRVCHLYENGVPITLCGAQCTEQYLLGTQFSGNGSRRSGRSVVEEILAERRWQEFGR
jgi:hypothetical protein